MDNLLDVVELVADFLGNTLQGVGVADEIEEGRGHSSRSGIGTSNDKQVGLAPELRSGETLASLWVASLEQIVKEVTTIRLLTQLGTLSELTLAVGHISSSASSQLGEQELVDLELINNRHSATDEMSRGSSFNELQRESVIRLLQHVEGLSKAQITQNIHGQVIAPVGHVAGLGPALVIGTGIIQTNLLAKGADIAQDVALHLLHGALGEGVREDAALAGVDVLVSGVVGVGSRVNKGIVELGLADVGLEAIDFLQSLVGVEGDGVGAESDNLAWKR